MDKAKAGAKDACKCCQDAVVPLDSTLAIVCLVLNCIPFTSGIGTCISACTGDKFRCHTLGIGILQWFLTGLLVGWIWSIMHGIWLYKAKK
mmetsp:Transcript_2608/g.3608  ORF Transcript_2608/g.3608 Transcript_2608/m.3608 type:complete len:91 (-) Transcript_2608:114-386(-)